MPRMPLVHNPLNEVTAEIWREGEVVHKVLTPRGDAPAHWVASPEPRHWNYWAREALAYDTGLPARLGLGAPRLLDLVRRPDGDLELRLEHVEGRHAAELTVEDLEAAAVDLGRAQGRPALPTDSWLSRGFLRAYSRTRPARWELLTDDAAWEQPLVREHFSGDLRARLTRLHEQHSWLLDLMERLPRTVCHLDVWPNNLLRRPDGEVVFLDWAFAGDGALGEDVGNLVPDAVFDLLLDHRLLDELDERVTAGYLRGLHESGWSGDERMVRLGMCASAVKYDWMVVLCLEMASAAAQPDYGHAGTVDAHARYEARSATLALCARWAEEAATLAGELGV